MKTFSKLACALSILLFTSISSFAKSGDGDKEDSLKTSVVEQAETENYSNVGLGLRFGDPTAISLALHTNKNSFLEFNLGWSNYYRGNGYYRDGFVRWYENDHNRYDRYEYVGARATSILLNGSYLWKAAIARGEGISGLNAYYGLGVQTRFNTITYQYRYFDEFGDGYEETRVTDIDLGPTGTLGIMYTFDAIPLSIFADLGLFLDIPDNPDIELQGGIGGRFTF